MKKTTFLFTIAAAATLLAGSPNAKAVNLSLNAVTPLDTFSFDIIAYSTSTTAGGAAYAVVPQTVTFGATTTFTGVGLGGYNVTVTSSETTSGTNTVDTINVSTPTNFVPAGYALSSGSVFNGVQLDIGDANAGANTVDLLTSLTTYTGTGTAIYGTANTAFTLIPGTTLSNNNQSVAAVEGINYSATTTAISGLAVHGFTYTITYPTVSAVPEPSTWATMGLGLVAGAVVIRRRRLAA